jgi:hypothetical protein
MTLKSNHWGNFRASSYSNGVNDLKPSKFGVITLLLFGMVIVSTGIVCADQPVPATPETQTLSTITTADVVGIAMETDAGVWTTTSLPNVLAFTGNGSAGPLDPEDLAQLIAAGGSIVPSSIPGFFTQIVIPKELLSQYIPSSSGTVTWQMFIDNYLIGAKGYTQVNGYGGIHTGVLHPAQIQYTTAYDANIVAQAGHTVLTKSMNIDTRNKVISQSNLNVKTGLTFAATADGGNVVGSENIMLDGAGNYTPASDRMLCPFSAYPVDQIPAYCNIVQAGSKYDLTIGEVTTNANDRFIGTDATNPVVLNYDINVKPYGSSQVMIPAMGSAMAYMKAHIQEARTNTSKAEDIVYNEQSSAQGTITAFTKVIAYQSGKSLL